MTITYATISSPLGDLLAATTPEGLVRLAYPEEDGDAVLEEMAALDPDLRAGLLDEQRRELDAYFAGTRQRFEISVDFSLVETGFTTRVLEATARIPYGETSTYGDVAGMAGSPRGARAAGNALRTNPVPVVVPCHRVIQASGGLGGYGGREDRKAWLLQLEGAWTGDLR